MTPSISSRFVTSGKANPCPICGRHEDGDCRISAAMVFCRYGSRRRPPEGLKPGDVVPGLDGVQWAYTKDTEDDGRCAVFTVDKPLERYERRVVPFRPPSTTPSIERPLQALPLLDPEQFSIARFDLDPCVVAAASWKEGNFWHYDENNRQERIGEGTEKKISIWRKTTSGQWIRQGSSDCPCWNEACLPFAEGIPIFAEGEKSAAALADAGILGLSFPGHYASSPDKCANALIRLKAKGLKAIAYLADNDAQGRKKAATVIKAAIKADLPYVAINAIDVWPDIPERGSIDDIKDSSAEEIRESLESAFKKALTEKQTAPLPSIDAAARLETESLKIDLQNVLEEYLEACLKDDDLGKQVACTKLWKFGQSEEVAQTYALKTWAQRNGIAMENKGKAPKSRIIGVDDAEASIKQLQPGFILENDLHLFVADAGTGKTFCTLELMTAASIGNQSFMDQEEGRAGSEKQKILYIATDGGQSAYAMLNDYCNQLEVADRGALIEVWAEDQENGTAPWTLTLSNLALLHEKLKEGEIKGVVIDTANAIFQGAGISPYVGPVDSYLRLLKGIVCPYSFLWIISHTNRNGQGLKSIGGHPAWQEVPSVIHIIERLKKNGEDNRPLYKWNVHKFRGESPRSFCYQREDGQFKIVEGNFYKNVTLQVLETIEKHELIKADTNAGTIMKAINATSASVYTALTRLRQRGFIKSKGRANRITNKGRQYLESIREENEKILD